MCCWKCARHHLINMNYFLIPSKSALSLSTIQLFVKLESHTCSKGPLCVWTIAYHAFKTKRNSICTMSVKRWHPLLSNVSHTADIKWLSITPRCLRPMHYSFGVSPPDEVRHLVSHDTISLIASLFLFRLHAKSIPLQSFFWPGVV